mgnify:CR=1 FL=1
MSSMTETLLTFGPIGLFIIAFLDSAMIPLAGGPDGALILLSMWHPRRALLYTGAATIGSAVGCLVLYTFARRAGERMLSRLTPSRRERIRQLLDQYDLLAIALAVFLPPPFPTKPMIAMAGVLGMPRGRFLTGVLLGRLVRYGVEGYLGARFGTRAIPILRQISPWLLLGGIVALVFVLLMKKRRRQ